MDGLARQRGRAEVVFAGTSMMRDAALPAEMSICRGPGSTCYNASLSAGVPTVMEHWLLDVVVPTLRPRVVVLGLSSLDFNDRGPRQKEAIATYTRAPEIRDDVYARAARAAARVSYLVRYRAVLRQPAGSSRG